MRSRAALLFLALSPSLLPAFPSGAAEIETVTVTANMTRIGEMRPWNPLDWDRMMRMRLSVNASETASLWMDLHQALPEGCAYEAGGGSLGLGEGVHCSVSFPYDVWGDFRAAKDLKIEFYDKDQVTADDLFACTRVNLYLAETQEIPDRSGVPLVRVSVSGRAPSASQRLRALGVDLMSRFLELLFREALHLSDRCI